MRRRTRLAATVTATLVAAALTLTACGGRTDGGSPIPTEATTSSSTPTG